MNGIEAAQKELNTAKPGLNRSSVASRRIAGKCRRTSATRPSTRALHHALGRFLAAMIAPDTAESG
ncbi:MAG: hypothetical protein OXG99_01965 [Alphaproteobacteria bacterium]|nr:hypothetical protein [Alphaproteobacteria bacterium]